MGAVLWLRGPTAPLIEEAMLREGSSSSETCTYISDLGEKLRHMAAAVGADRLAALLAELVKTANAHVEEERITLAQAANSRSSCS